MRPLDQLVAVAMVAVGMGVHEHVDRRRRRRRPAQRVEHLGREHEVEEGVDEQRLVAVDDEAGVTPSPPAVRLEIGEQPVTDLVHDIEERPRADPLQSRCVSFPLLQLDVCREDRGRIGSWPILVRQPPEDLEGVLGEASMTQRLRQGAGRPSSKTRLLQRRNRLL